MEMETKTAILKALDERGEGEAVIVTKHAIDKHGAKVEAIERRFQALEDERALRRATRYGLQAINWRT